jgi:hypothetical protein
VRHVSFWAKALVLGLAVAASWGSSTAAQAPTSIAGTVVLANGEGAFDERAYVLTVELGLRALALEVAPALPGADRLAREGAARELAAARGALATLWIDHDVVCAIASAGAARCAALPRPSETVDLRVLSVLFGSVLDEAMSPPAEAGFVMVELPSSVASSVSAPEEAEEPIPEHPTRDGELYLYALTESSVGALWSPGEQRNITHLVQRVGAGALFDTLRVESMLGMGIDQSIDGSYKSAFTVDGQAFIAASFPIDSIALDLGGVIGGVGHEHVVGLSPSEAGAIEGVPSLVMRARLLQARGDIARLMKGDPLAEALMRTEGGEP